MELSRNFYMSSNLLALLPFLRIHLSNYGCWDFRGLENFYCSENKMIFALEPTKLIQFLIMGQVLIFSTNRENDCSYQAFLAFFKHLKQQITAFNLQDLLF